MTRHAVSVMSIILWLASESSGIAASFESNADVPVLDGVELLNRDSDDDSITIVSEEHSIIPAQELLTLRKHSDVLLEIIEGPARFIYKPGAQGDAKILTKVTYQADHVRLPAIVHGDEKHNSYISIMVDGSVICKPLRLAALPRGIFELYGELPSFAPAILRLDLARGYALIDEANMDDAAAIRDLQESQKFQELTEKLEQTAFGFKRPIEDGDPPEWCPLDVAPLPPSDYSNQSCTINIDPRGRVSWDFSPTDFSYKRESIDSPLLWATFPSNSNIDGIYNHQRGCGVALKIPNNCHLITNSSALGFVGKCCRGVLAIARGARCSFIAPGIGAAGNWPACPL